MTRLPSSAPLPPPSSLPETGAPDPRRPGRLHVAFIYAGNGCQWTGMGASLLGDPVFHHAVTQVDALYRPLSGLSLLEELAGPHDDADRYQRIELAQPALFALQVGLTALLRAQGLHASAVGGHSIGEVAAAWACGALTLEDATCVMYHRSQAQAASLGRGQMTAVALGQDAAQALLDAYTQTEPSLQAQRGTVDDISIAGVNSSRGVTLAGPAARLAQIESLLASRRIPRKRLALDYAFHSPAVQPEQDQVLKALADIQPRRGDIAFYSSVTGTRLSGTQLDARYWWANIRQPVLFAQAMQHLITEGFHDFIEIGAHPILHGYIQDALRQADIKDGKALATLHRGHDEVDALPWGDVA